MPARRAQIERNRLSIQANGGSLAALATTSRTRAVKRDYVGLVKGAVRQAAPNGHADGTKQAAPMEATGERPSRQACEPIAAMPGDRVAHVAPVDVLSSSSQAMALLQAMADEDGAVANSPPRSPTIGHPNSPTGADAATSTVTSPMLWDDLDDGASMLSAHLMRDSSDPAALFSDLFSGEEALLPDGLDLSVAHGGGIEVPLSFGSPRGTLSSDWRASVYRCASMAELAPLTPLLPPLKGGGGGPVSAAQDLVAFAPTTMMFSSADVESAAVTRPSSRQERKEWTAVEDELICQGVQLHGGKWRRIAAQLPGRSDDAVRNRWHRLKELQPPEAQEQPGSFDWVISGAFDRAIGRCPPSASPSKSKDSSRRASKDSSKDSPKESSKPSAKRPPRRSSAPSKRHHGEPAQPMTPEAVSPAGWPTAISPLTSGAGLGASQPQEPSRARGWFGASPPDGSRPALSSARRLKHSSAIGTGGRPLQQSESQLVNAISTAMCGGGGRPGGLGGLGATVMELPLCSPAPSTAASMSSGRALQRNAAKAAAAAPATPRALAPEHVTPIHGAPSSAAALGESSASPRRAHPPKMERRSDRIGWSRSEDQTIINGVAAYGHKWAQIAERLPGRTEHATRNRYHRLQNLAMEAKVTSLAMEAKLTQQAKETGRPAAGDLLPSAMLPSAMLPVATARLLANLPSPKPSLAPGGHALPSSHCSPPGQTPPRHLATSPCFPSAAAEAVAAAVQAATLTSGHVTAVATAVALPHAASPVLIPV